MFFFKKEPQVADCVPQSVEEIHLRDEDGDIFSIFAHRKTQPYV